MLDYIYIDDTPFALSQDDQEKIFTDNIYALYLLNNQDFFNDYLSKNSLGIQLKSALKAKHTHPSLMGIKQSPLPSRSISPRPSTTTP